MGLRVHVQNPATWDHELGQIRDRSLGYSAHLHHNDRASDLASSANTPRMPCNIRSPSELSCAIVIAMLASVSGLPRSHQFHLIPLHVDLPCHVEIRACWKRDLSHLRYVAFVSYIESKSRIPMSIGRVPQRDTR
jgi:hypothetical protein